ncbi:hypothetical protein BDQ17DRAFT_1431257 [Cyathus striatus]|nr:hypothetical protein BDQ17DRAFT_1431257 [Cyathus striatus]
MLREYLEGPALIWFRDEVLNPFLVKEKLSFEEIMTGLYNRFVHNDMYDTGMMGFYAIWYKASEEVQTLYDTMIKYSNSMSQLVDDKTFHQTFVNAFPDNICKHVMIQKELNPKVHPVKLFLHEAVKYKLNKRMYTSNETYLDHFICPLTTKTTSAHASSSNAQPQ